MKAVLCVAVQVVLCFCAMAFVDPDGCQRTPEELISGKKDPNLVREMQEHLNVTLKDGDNITGFTVYDEEFDKVANVFFFNREETQSTSKTGKAILFIYGSSDDAQSHQATPIPYSKYKQYLDCTVLADE